MTSIGPLPATLATSLLVAALLAPAHSDAAVPKRYYQNGGSACTGALPTFEGSLRKRPKAITNEGDTTAFITCSADSDEMNSTNPNLVFISLRNNGPATISVSCTLVNGAEWSGSLATPQTISLAPGARFNNLWVPVSPATAFPYDSVNVSCALPPGVEANYFGYGINLD